MMREVITIMAIATSAALVACGAGDEARSGGQRGGESGGELERFLERGSDFVESTQLRRRALEQSLVNRHNGYSKLRLEKYALEDGGWDALGVWNPPVRPVTTDDLGAFVDRPYAVSVGQFEPAYPATTNFRTSKWTHEAMVELGRRLFERYPVQLDPAMAAAVTSSDRTKALGLWTDRRGRLGGLVRVRLPDGRESFSMTCATCHASPNTAGELVYGRTNARLDRDKIGRIHAGGPSTSAWGPGQVDVTPDEIDNPTAITDLRATRFQSRLHWAATLRNSPESLSVRIETLIITSHGQAVRPPREVAFALAYYLWSLGGGAEREQSLAGDERDGQTLFEEQCSRCHHADGTTAGTAEPVLIGTDTAVVDSPMRTTGAWRIPSLWKVGERSQFLHDGSIDSLDELFDPMRLETTQGHVFGTGLSASQRRDLVAYLSTR
jgi:mono/diheme cytochrome c family protein